MSDPDQIRAEIERTRAELGGNVDALADKVTPSKVAGRQADKVKQAVGGVRDRVMGAASSASDSAGSTAGSVGDSLSDGAQTVKAKASGNPLAVGLIAFGVGWLAASLLPGSTKEQELASTIKDKAQPLVEKTTDAAKEVADNLREPAKDAAAAVKDVATDAASTVKEGATSAASDVKDQANEARHAVQDQG